MNNTIYKFINIECNVHNFNFHKVDYYLNAYFNQIILLVLEVLVVLNK